MQMGMRSLSCKSLSEACRHNGIGCDVTSIMLKAVDSDGQGTKNGPGIFTYQQPKGARARATYEHVKNTHC